MEELYDKYKSDKRLLSQLNRCKLAVHGIIVADIMDASGETLMTQQPEG